MKCRSCCTHLQTERAGDVGLRQRDAHAGDVGLLQPLRQQLNAEKLVQPRQTLHMEGQDEHHAGLASPQWSLQNLHHVFHVFVETVQTWRRGQAEACGEDSGETEMEYFRLPAVVFGARALDGTSLRCWLRLELFRCDTVALESRRNLNSSGKRRRLGFNSEIM